jgi:hypothetical protein
MGGRWPRSWEKPILISTPVSGSIRARLWLGGDVITAFAAMRGEAASVGGGAQPRIHLLSVLWFRTG